MKIIKLKDISKTYGKEDAVVQALKNINLTINSSELIVIMGPSGSGKSTLLNIIGCLDKATKGSYYIKDQDVTGINNSKLAQIRNKTFGLLYNIWAY